MYKKYFSKCRMNSISQVEYFSSSNLVWVSQQFDIETAIIDKNSSRFKLAYSFPLLKSLLLDQLRICGNTEEAHRLIHEMALIEAGDLFKILFLFHKDNDLNIPSVISLSNWVSH